MCVCVHVHVDATVSWQFSSDSVHACIVIDGLSIMCFFGQFHTAIIAIIDTRCYITCTSSETIVLTSYIIQENTHLWLSSVCVSGCVYSS